MTSNYLQRMQSLDQESTSSEIPASPLPKSRSRRKIGYLPMTTITSLDIPTEDEMTKTLATGIE